MAKIYVNGDAQEVSLPLNVSELIKQLLVENPEMVSVQVNEEFAERDDWETTVIKEGDQVDFLYFMGGGALVIRGISCCRMSAWRDRRES